MDLSTTIEPKSDQQNFDDYTAGPRTVTVERVRVLGKSADQPVEIHLVEYPGRPYKPSKTMRRVLVLAWGKDGEIYAGRQMTLYGDPKVKFAGEEVGGIKISHLSHIDAPLTFSLTESKGHRASHTVQPLVSARQATPAEQVVDDFARFFEVSREQLVEHMSLAFDDWTPETIAKLKVLGGELNRGEKTVAEVFGQP